MEHPGILCMLVRGGRTIVTMTIAQGQNDSVDRIYGSDRTFSCIREYSWNGTSYDEITINAPQSVVRVVAGPARNDGVNRIYGAGYLGHINEYTYTGSNWNRIDIHPSAPLLSRFGVCIGRAKSDGALRLYSVAKNGAIREHSWDGGTWSDTIIDAITGATANITVGMGRNDDTARVYVVSSNGYIYEFTNDSPYTGIETHYPRILKETILNIYPNPALNKTTISYYLPQSGQVKLTIYDILGNEVYRLVDNLQSMGHHIIYFDGRNRMGSKISAGVYFVRLETSGYAKTEKVVFIR